MTTECLFQKCNCCQSLSFSLIHSICTDSLSLQSSLKHWCSMTYLHCEWSSKDLHYPQCLQKWLLTLSTSWCCPIKWYMVFLTPLFLAWYDIFPQKTPGFHNKKKQFSGSCGPLETSYDSLCVHHYPLIGSFASQWQYRFIVIKKGKERTGSTASNVWIKAVAHWWQWVDARQPLGTCSSAGLVGMPRLFAVVAEVHTAARPFTVNLWTTGTARCYHCIPNKWK